jgi:HEAT repeat protein
MWGSMLDKISQLIEAKNAKNVSEVRDYLDDRWDTVREVATVVLSEIGSREDFYVILEMLDDKSPNVRLAATYGLGNLADADSLPILQQLVKEKKEAPVQQALKTVIESLKKKKKK